MSVATKLDDRAVYQSMGTVVRIEGDVIVVSGDGGELRATRATSCLVAPEVHDFVLVAAQGRGAYVLAVLERESPDATIVSRGNLDLRAGEGKIRATAKEGIDLVSPKTVSMMAGQVGVHASTLKLVAQNIVALGGKVLGEVTEVRLKGSILDRVFERVSERVKRSFRHVEEIDQLRAKQLDYLTEETMSLRSENMVATAKELVKVDGEQIHFG